MIGLQVPDLSSMLRNGLQTPLNVRGENSGPASGSSHIGALQEAVLVEEHCVPSGPVPMQVPAAAAARVACASTASHIMGAPPPPPFVHTHNRRRWWWRHQWHHGPASVSQAGGLPLPPTFAPATVRTIAAQSWKWRMASIRKRIRRRSRRRRRVVQNDGTTPLLGTTMNMTGGLDPTSTTIPPAMEGLYCHCYQSYGKGG